MGILVYVAGVAGAYAAFSVLLTVPWFQKHLLYLHKVKWPPFARYDLPEKYGLAPHKTLNYTVTTPDGCRLGVWHVLPHKWYREATRPFPPAEPLHEERFEDALASNLTIISFHGNAATRAIGDRTRTYTALSTRLNCNVIAPDYRGFADSTGSPGEAGLLMDARAVWDHTVARLKRARERSGSKNDKVESTIAVMGHSLGTGVASALVKQLQDEGIHPRALILLAPFTSIPDLLATYRLGTVIPLLGPLKIIPGLQGSLLKLLRDRFDSRKALKGLEVPTLIAHTLDDNNIPASHSAALFSSLQGPDEEASTVNVAQWGTLRRSRLANGESLMWWEGRFGGHNGVIYDDGVIDLVAEIMQTRD